LLDFFYAQPVSHAIEALHHALALHRADPTRELSLLLNAATPTELATCCAFITATYPVRAPFVEPAPDADRSLHHVPRDWDWILDDPRRHQDFQFALFAGMRDHYAASDRWFNARIGRRPLGFEPPSRAPHQQLRLALPARARDAAAARAPQPARSLIAFMPAGSSHRSSYPSLTSLECILDALWEAEPDVRVLLVGRLRRDDRTATALGRSELERLLEHRMVADEVFDRPLLEQLAVVERCGVFISPHTGSGMAALAVALHGWRSRAAAGLSGISTVCRSARSCLTQRAIGASRSSPPTCPSLTGRTATGSRA